MLICCGQTQSLRDGNELKKSNLIQGVPIFNVCKGQQDIDNEKAKYGKNKELSVNTKRLHRLTQNQLLWSTFVYFLFSDH